MFFILHIKIYSKITKYQNPFEEALFENPYNLTTLIDVKITINLINLLI